MEGQRVEKTQGGRRKGPIIAALVVAVVLCAYLGLCAWVGSSDKILPNVTVAGVDVSGLTAEEAQEAVNQAVSGKGDEAVVTLTYGSWSGTLKSAEFRTLEDGAGQAAHRVGRDNFLTQGFQYLRHAFGAAKEVALDRTVDATAQPALNALLDQADQAVGGGVVEASYQMEGDKLVMTRGKTGMAIDRDRTLFIVADAMEEAIQQAIAQGSAEVRVDLKEQNTAVETPPQEPDFDAIHQELYTEAKSAEMSAETHQITDHVVGVDFDVEALKTAYEQAAEGETFTIPLTLTQPKETKASLSAKLFKDLLGQGTTNVGGSSNRKTNVKLSAAACNGVILLPGEVFSYNNTTGSRSADKGYLSAPIYQAGQSVDDIGGGICQTSSTIYYAVLHTSLEIVERHDHQFNTGYVDPGMDATVFYGSLDFRFKNNTNYPVKIVTESYDQGGKRKLTVKIYGTNENGVRAVPESTVYDKVTPTTKYQADNTVPRGTLVLDKKQYAYTGMSAKTYRYIYAKDGTLLEKQNMGVSKYQMRPHLYHYNPLDGDPSSWPNGVPPKPVVEQPVTPPVEPVTPTEPVTPVEPAEPETPVTPDAGQGETGGETSQTA